jgi:hypothetical protein
MPREEKLNRSIALAAFAVSVLFVAPAPRADAAAVQSARNIAGPRAIVYTTTIDTSGNQTPAAGANAARLANRNSSVRSLLPVIASWLAENFNLPASNEYPRIAFVPRAKLYAMLFGGQGASESTNSANTRGQSARRNGRHVVEALYDKISRTMYLHEGWTGAKPAEVSVLVHEMVHHLQNVAGLKFDCPQASEELAYQAQDR